MRIAAEFGGWFEAAPLPLAIASGAVIVGAAIYFGWRAARRDAG